MSDRVTTVGVKQTKRELMTNQPPMATPPQDSGNQYVQVSGNAANSEFAPLKVDFATAVTRAFSKYATFKGRASQSEYWFFFLGNLVVIFSLLILSATIGVDSNGDQNASGTILGLALIAWYLVSILPALGLLVRRLHDTGHSGWFYWIVLIPFVGAIILLVSLAKKGDVDTNQYGPAS
jgi:uncharacterized membrane protein YhaH (DUF805 family)